MIRFKPIYSLWFVLNTVLFIWSGYPLKVLNVIRKLPYLDENWTALSDHFHRLYLLTSNEIVVYDITEYSLAVLIPVFGLYIYKAFEPKRLKYQKPPNIYY